MKPDFELTQDEQNARLAAAATVYGVGTRSYNRSAEKKELDRQKAAVTAKYEAGPKVEKVVGPICTCLSFRIPHPISAHCSLKSDYDWQPWETRYIFNREHNCFELTVQRYPNCLPRSALQRRC